MSLSITLTGRKNKLSKVSLYDYNGNLRREIWFYGDGSVEYKEWNAKGMDMEFGKVTILEPIMDL